MGRAPDSRRRHVSPHFSLPSLPPEAGDAQNLSCAKSLRVTEPAAIQGGGRQRDQQEKTQPVGRDLSQAGLPGEQGSSPTGSWRPVGDGSATLT